MAGKNVFSIRNASLKWKSVVIFVLLVTFPTLLVANVVLIRYDQILRQQFIDSLVKNLTTVELNLSEKIKAVEDISDYMIYQPYFRQFMTTPYQPSTMQQIHEHKKEIEGFASFHLMSKRYIKSISIIGVSGNELHMGEPMAGRESEWNDAAKERKGGVVWSDSYSVVGAWTGPKRVISMFRAIHSFDQLPLQVGWSVIRLDEADFSALLMNAVPPETGSAFILRSDGRVVLHPDDTRIGQTYPDRPFLQQLAANRNRTFQHTLNGEPYLVFSREMKTVGWNIVAMIPEANIVQKTESLRASLQAMLIAILILGLLALVGFELTIIRPILELRKETARLKTGDFSARVKVRSRDEIGDLGRQFNNMVQTIKDLIDHKYKLEIRQRESELKLLQSQTDPHFLYNTLDMIRWKARLERAMETSHLIEMLSRFFRASLSRDKLWTTLQDEMELVQSYLELQQKRLGNKLQFTLAMDDRLKQAQLLKKVIQPLVENSIKHGFTGKRGGTIEVRCYQAGPDLWVDVIDSGAGFSREVAEKIREALRSGTADEPFSGHAICNIHERISIVSGSGYGVELPDHDGPGAVVRLKMPLMINRRESGRDDVKEGAT